MSNIKWTLPLRTYSEANDTSPWREKHRRHKLQKYYIYACFKGMSKKIELPVHIKLTRYAPRTLDKYDNLPMSFKYILDEICAQLRPGMAAGRADDTDEITVEYHQVKENCYKIDVEFLH